MAKAVTHKFVISMVEDFLRLDWPLIDHSGSYGSWINGNSSALQLFGCGLFEIEMIFVFVA